MKVERRVVEDGGELQSRSDTRNWKRLKHAIDTAREEAERRAI